MVLSAYHLQNLAKLLGQDVGTMTFTSYISMINLKI